VLFAVPLSYSTQSPLQRSADVLVGDINVSEKNWLHGIFISINTVY